MYCVATGVTSVNICSARRLCVYICACSSSQPIAEVTCLTDIDRIFAYQKRRIECQRR